MPADEYSTLGGGGKLKLKGSKVADGRVEKKKKKKQKENKKASPGRDADQQQPQVQEQEQQQPDETTTTRDSSRAPDEAGRGEESSSSLDIGSAGKTEAERRHEEMKKRRLQERLKREGVKTHKERVEELNKYLSRLSEHHDMPKIGPG
ncbi:DUF1754-domain-containing protein [Aspergillus saccharolyticus JOP 1030-1]|uniref:DUF1754-domain-containing protein n=1 Tax=Aspergillus saccharolyticus JOP 1030-1 TaxID=1450539 RepID=A0A318ZLA7_9EURO|nr:DUF1754-domain-containing protein [Aspergillus saccharolyticus JOP 1030-1]PYH48379.1 DUF1754-domain-containing protein [Aspergillus saccharolyticus JOP 1030-1]